MEEIVIGLDLIFVADTEKTPFHMPYYIDVLQAMNTGHDGSLSTGHANSVKDMLSRLETMVLGGAANLPVEVVRKQITSSIDVMVHLQRLRDRSRRVTEITEIAGMKDGEIQLNSLYRFVESGTSLEGKVEGGLRRTGQSMQRVWKLEMAGLA